jgi:cellulose synthase operon protein C
MTARELFPNRHRRTFRRAGAVVLAAIGLSVGASFPALAVNPESSKFFDDALVRLERDDIAGAIIQLNNALQKDPNMLAAHVLLGKARLRNRDPAGAETSFEKALKLGADRAEVALPLAQAYAEQGKADALLERIMPAGLPRQSQIEILILRGNAQANKGNTADALRSLDEARALDPQSIAVRLALVNVLLRTGDKTRATAVLDETIKLAPNDSAVWNLRASLAHLNGNLPAALADYAKAIALDPGNADALVAQAGLLLDLGRLEEADLALANLQQVAPREPRAAYLRAVAAGRRNDSDAVRAQLSNVVGLLDPVPKEVLSRYGQMLLLGGLSHYGLGNTEKASQYLAIYLKLNPKHPGASKLLASIYIDRGDPARAIDLLEPLESLSPNDPQLLSLLAAANMAQRRYDEAAAYLEKAVKVSGGTPDLRADFGVSLIGSGHAEVGLSQLQQAFAKDPGQARAGMVMTTLYLKRDQPKKALEVIDVVVRRDPKNVDAANMQGVARVAAGDRAGGRAAYENALALNPRYHAARLNLARLDLAEGKIDATRLRLTELLKIAPNNADAMIEFARLEEQTGHPSEAVAWLEKVRVVPAHRVRAGMYLVDLLLRQRNVERAVIVAKEVVSHAPKNFSALRTLSRAELAAGDKRGARQTLSVMVPLAGFEPDMNVELARLQFAAEDRESAAYSLDKVLKNKADYLPALVLLAEMEIARGDYAKAEQHARRIAERYPARGVGLRLMGDLAVARGQTAIATTNYRAALGKEKDVDTALRLYRTLVRGGDPAKGLIFLEQWSKDNPDDLFVLREVADGRLRAGNLTAARTDYERLLQRSPNDVEVLNNLAQVANRQGDKAALGYAERAYQLANKNAAILDTLGWLLVRQGQLERGTSLLRDARLRDSSNPEIRYHLAFALAQSGRDAEARSELNEGLKGAAAFGELEAARKLQQKLGP